LDFLGLVGLQDTRVWSHAVQLGRGRLDLEGHLESTRIGNVEDLLDGRVERPCSTAIKTAKHNTSKLATALLHPLNAKATSEKKSRPQ